MPISISDHLRAKAAAHGFDYTGITVAQLEPHITEKLGYAIAHGYTAEMDWLARAPELRGDPHQLWPESQSALVFTANYHQGLDHQTRLQQQDCGVISVYALNRDYHEVMKSRLKQMARWLAQETTSEVKVFVDTAPLMEKPLSQQAGLGWQGKHTNLVSRSQGSWFFLGVILTTARLPHDTPEKNHCGSCQACLEACPTAAFPAPYQLDARRCLSYLTIEHKGTIPLEFRVPMGNRIYGCDDCLAACPWNKFAQLAQELHFAARHELVAPALKDLAQLDEAAFRNLFSHSPVKRIGRNRFLRNVMIAIGNSGDQSLRQSALSGLRDSSELVRSMAVWALSRLMAPADFDNLRQIHAPVETEEIVQIEWQRS